MEPKFVFIQTTDRANTKPGVIRVEEQRKHVIVKDDGRYSLTPKIYDVHIDIRYLVVEDVKAFLELNKLAQLWVCYAPTLQDAISIAEELGTKID